MGRSNPTYRDILSSLRDEWRDFRRGLRREDKEHFDRLFDRAEQHADAAGYQNPPEPFKAFLLSVLIEQEKAIQRRTE